MKKLLVILLAGLILFSCGKNEDTQSNQNIEDWGISAVNYTEDFNKQESEQKIRIAVIDSGNNNKLSSIKESYNVIDDTADVADLSGHGTAIIYKLNELFPMAEIIPVKITNDAENISPTNLVKGINKAVEFNVDVINLSLGTIVNYDEVRQAVVDAQEQGIIIVSSAENITGEALTFPASYDGVISVIARGIDNFDVKNSSVSSDKRSYSAPGVSILCDEIIMDGSSVAAVYVTALIGKILDINNNLQLCDIETVLRDSCIFSTEYSYGMINYKRALDIVKTEY